MGEEVKEKKPNKYVEGFKGFCRFLYNPDDHTVFGRGGVSWAKIMVFYFFFYSCLAAFFAVCLIVMLQTLDPDTPTVVGRTNKPMVAIPEIGIYKMNFKDADGWETYKKALNKVQERYAEQNGEEGFFQWSQDNLGACHDPSVATQGTGGDTAVGCFFFGLNRIYGWNGISDNTTEMTFGCKYVAGKTGSGNLNPSGFDMDVSDVSKAMTAYYPWESLGKNGLQPVASAQITIDKAAADQLGDNEREIYVECQAYIRDIDDTEEENWEVLPGSRPASFEIIY